MNNDVELIVRPSKVLYDGLAYSQSYAGCTSIKVPFDLTNYDGGSFIYEDAIYGVIEDTYDVVGIWNGTFISIAPRTCVPYTDNGTGTIRITLPVTKYLELYLNETISQNWRFSDLQTFDALGSFSREFRVPATQNNCEAIGYLTDVNIDAEIDYLQVKLPAELRVQTLPIASGYIRVMRVITQAAKLADFEVTFYAESPDLFNKISGKMLKDIKALKDLNVVLDYNEVLAASGYPYLYSLTDYGQKWDQTGSLGSRSIYTTTIFGAPRAGDLTPSLNWQWIFEKIITEAGFTYDALNLENALYRYYAPWINSKSLNYEDSPQSYLFKIYNATSFLMTNSVQYTWPSSGEVFDNGSTVVGNTFTAPLTGIYYFRYWYTFTSPSSPTGINFRLFFQNVSTGATVLINETVIVAGTNNFDSANGAPPFFLSAGDDFRLVYQAVSNGVILKDGVGYNNGTGLELLDIDFMDGATLDWSANAPDVTQADFLRDVLNMHCCVVVPDRTVPNKIIIEPIKDYVGTGTARDWSKKLDISKDITLTNTSDFQNKRLKFSYSAGDDMFSKIYTDVGRTYGEYKIENYTVSENDVPNDFARDGEQKIQLETQSTPSNYIKGTSIVIPKFLNSDGDFVNPKLRCLFYAGDVEMTLFNFGTSTPDTTYVAPILNHYEFILPFFNSLDLNWAPEVPLYVQGVNPLNNLFNLYWRDYLNQLYSPNARIVECYLALDLADILGFTFADRIWINTAWWRILEISDYKVGDGDVTKVTLLKLIDAVPETSARPTSTTDGGVVEFVDSSGNPTAPTQQACERYGYTWDPLTQSCYAFTSQPQNTQVAVSGKSVGVSTRQVSSADNTLVMADNLDSDPSNTYSVTVGADIKMEANNMESIAVGEKLTKEGDGGVAMFGKNVFTNVPGLHFGGGYRDGNSTSPYQGWAQYGVIILHRKEAFLATNDKIYLNIQGVDGWHLNIPDATAWSCMLNVMLIDDSLAIYYGSQVNFTLLKTGGIALYAGVTAVSENGVYGGHTFGVDIDTTTNTDEHRIGVKSTGGTYPLSTIITASLTYQQTKIA